MAQFSRLHLLLLGLPILLMVPLTPILSPAQNLIVDGGATFTVPGDITFNNEIIGQFSTGTLNQGGFTNTINQQLRLGENPGSSGVYNLSGGSLNLTFSEFVGYSGSGVFNQTGGSNTTAQFFNLGLNPGSSGVFNLSGGTLTVGKGGFVGYSGSGVFNQSGGGATLTEDLVLGNFAGSSGVYNLNGGSLSVRDEIIGNLGSGIFNQTGGTNLVARDLIIARAGGSGTYKFLGGSLSAGTIQVNPGGTFLGAGSLSAQFTNNGLVKPGTSIGTLNIVGSYTQGPNGTLEIEVESPTSFDRINVTGTPGTATLAGTLQTVFLGGSSPGGRALPIITTTGGVTGTFTTLNFNRQLTPTLFQNIRYNPFSVELVFTRDYTNPGLGLSSNQLAVGSMLNSVAGTVTGDLDQVLSTIDLLPHAGLVREAYKQISPEKLVPLPDLAFAAAILQQNSLARRITDLRFGTREMSTAGGFPALASLFGSQGNGGLMLAYDGAGLPGMLPAMPKAASGKRWGVFLDPAVLVGSQGSSDNQTGYDYTLAGFTLGVDYRLRRDLLVGLATGYSHNNAFLKGTGGKITNNTWPLTGYVAYLPEKGYAFASLGYTLNLFDLEREVSFAGINRRAKGSTSGHQFNLYAEAGYDLKIKPVVITPAASLAFATISVAGFSESNAGSLNLEVDSQNADSLQTGVGAKIAAPIKKNSLIVVPQAYAFYQHEFSNDSRGLDARLSQGSSTFTFVTDEVKRDFALVGGNINWFMGNNLSAMVNYNAQVGRSNNTVHQVNAGLRYNF